MSTAKDESGVLHIDGPPTAGFVVADPADPSKRVEVRYKILRYVGTKSECMEIFHSLKWVVTTKLREVKVDNPPPGLADKIIWWRHRPEITFDTELDKCVFFCRFDTTPPLPASFWERWECPESQPARNAREVVG